MNSCIFVFYEYCEILIRIQKTSQTFFQFNGYGDKTAFEICNGSLNLSKHKILSGPILGVWNDE